MSLTQIDLQTAWLIGQVGILQSKLGESNLSTKRASATVNENERLTISNTLLLLENSQLRAKLLHTYKRSSVSRFAKSGEHSPEWETLEDVDSEHANHSVDTELELTIVDDNEFITELSQTDLALAWYQAESMIKSNAGSKGVVVEGKIPVRDASVPVVGQTDLALAWYHAESMIKSNSGSIGFASEEMPPKRNESFSGLGQTDLALAWYQAQSIIQANASSNGFVVEETAPVHNESVKGLNQTDLALAWYQADSMIKSNAGSNDFMVEEQALVRDESIAELSQSDLALAWYQAESMIKSNAFISKPVRMGDEINQIDQSKADVISQALEERLIDVIDRLESLPESLSQPEPEADLGPLNQRLEVLVNRLESYNPIGLSSPIETRLLDVVERLESLPEPNVVHSSQNQHTSTLTLTKSDISTQTEEAKTSSVVVINPRTEVEVYQPSTVILQPYVAEDYSRQVIVLENISEPVPVDNTRRLSVETLPAIDNILSVEEAYLPSPRVDSNVDPTEPTSIETAVQGGVVVINPSEPEEYRPEVVVLSPKGIPEETYIPTVVVLEKKQPNLNETVFYEGKIKLDVTRIGQRARQILFDNQGRIEMDAPIDLESTCMHIITSLLEWALRGGREREGFMVTYESEAYYLQSRPMKDEIRVDAELEKQKLLVVQKEMEEKLREMGESMERERTAFEDLVMLQIHNRRRNLNGNVK